jgi:F0F1-type ATP synthase membrane subunit b/b'
MSKELKEILQEILQELKGIRQESKEIRKSVARFDEFILELAPSEAQEEIKNLE